MTERYAVPVEYVMALNPDAELVFDHRGENPRLVLPGTGTLPVVLVTAADDDWPVQVGS